MTVEELIKELLKVEDKKKKVFGWHSDLDITNIHTIDELEDRVDINLQDGWE